MKTIKVKKFVPVAAITDKLHFQFQFLNGLYVLKLIFRAANLAF